MTRVARLFFCSIIAIICTVPTVAIADEDAISKDPNPPISQNAGQAWEDIPVWQRCEDDAGNERGDSNRLTFERRGVDMHIDAPVVDADITKLMHLGKIDSAYLRIMLNDVDAQEARAKLSTLSYAHIDEKELSNINEVSIACWDWITIEVGGIQNMQFAIDELWTLPEIRDVDFIWHTNENIYAPEIRSQFGLTEKPIASNFPVNVYHAPHTLLLYLDTSISKEEVLAALTSATTLNTEPITQEEVFSPYNHADITVEVAENHTLQDAIDELWGNPCIASIGPQPRVLTTDLLCTPRTYNLAPVEPNPTPKPMPDSTPAPNPDLEKDSTKKEDSLSNSGTNKPSDTESSTMSSEPQKTSGNQTTQTTRKTTAPHISQTTNVSSSSQVPKSQNSLATQQTAQTNDNSFVGAIAGLALIAACTAIWSHNNRIRKN